MAKKSNLPIEIHDHFRKANILNGYVTESLGTARDHALEAGQELMAAKAGCPPKSWETECVRLFDGSLRTARGYMAFAKHMGALPKTARHAVLMLEGTLDGAAKAAKAAAKPKPPKPQPAPDEPINLEVDPVDGPETPEAACVTCPNCGHNETDEDGDCAKCHEPDIANAGGERMDDDEPLTTEEPCFGKCPNCTGTKWEEDEEGHVDCAKCRHPHGEPAGDVDADRITTQRQKTVKTAEALMRAFDDLQTMSARSEHSEMIACCKILLKVAKEWK